MHRPSKRGRRDPAKPPPIHLSIPPTTPALLPPRAAPLPSPSIPPASPNPPTAVRNSKPRGGPRSQCSTSSRRSFSSSLSFLAIPLYLRLCVCWLVFLSLGVSWRPRQRSSASHSILSLPRASLPLPFLSDLRPRLSPSRGSPPAGRAPLFPPPHPLMTKSRVTRKRTYFGH